MSRILIVTNGPLARNPRVVKEAQSLGAAGYRTTVLTLRNHAPSEQYDQALCEDAPFRRIPVDLVSGFSTPSHRIFWRLLRHRVAREAMSRFGLQSLHALGPARVLEREIRAHPSDLVIVHNEVPHGVGLKLISEGQRVAADIEDWHSEDLLEEARSKRPIALLRKQECALLHRAVYCTTTSHALAEALHERYGGNLPAVISNSFPLAPAPVAQTSSPSSPPRLLWFSQTIGPGRGLEAFMAAWALTTAPSILTLVGEDRDHYTDCLRDSLPATHASRLEILPLVSPQKLPTLIAAYDVGLALEPRSPANKDLTISNKILQYLGSGLTVVATPTAGQREVLKHSPEAGLICSFEDPVRSAAALDSLLQDRKELMRRRHLARCLAAEHYCWERESPRLLELVEQALKN